MTLSRKRTAVAVSASSRVSSSRASGVNGLSISRARLIEPSRQAPYGGSGCSPQLWATKPLASKALRPGMLTS